MIRGILNVTVPKSQVSSPTSLQPAAITSIIIPEFPGDYEGFEGLAIFDQNSHFIIDFIVISIFSARDGT